MHHANARGCLILLEDPDGGEHAASSTLGRKIQRRRADAGPDFSVMRDRGSLDVRPAAERHSWEQTNARVMPKVELHALRDAERPKIARIPSRPDSPSFRRVLIRVDFPPGGYDSCHVNQIPL